VTGTEDEISEETRLMAARVRERAAGMPTAQQLADLSASAFTKQGEGMSPAQIRELVTEAITQSQRMAWLLGKLAGLDGEGDPDGQ
jgi:hypothetical protein